MSHESMSSTTTLTNAVSDKPEKAALPIAVTLSGMVTDVKPLQPRKASCPIDVTLSGMVTDVKPLQPEYLQRNDSQVDANKTVEK